MKKPSKRQMAYLEQVVKELLDFHGITEAGFSPANPFLQALLIPTTQGKAKVKAFANDLFYKLGLRLLKDVFSFGMANRYCALDEDKVHGCYLVIFNHPAIFDYPEDSPEGMCAHGEMKY